MTSAGALAAACFLVGAATLGLELAVARVVALHAGVSLYGWASTIGGVLAGVALGSAIGGRVADRGSPRPNADGTGPARSLSVALVGAAGWAMVPVPVAASLPALSALQALPPLPRILLLVALLTLVPSVLLGAAGPLLARLAIRSPVGVGGRVGLLWGATTAGSLAGTAATGLLFVPGFGVRGAVLAAAAGLVLAALVVDPPPSPTRRRWLVVLPLLGVLLVGATPSACDRESAYQCIRVEDDETATGRPYRTLYLDSLPHSSVSLVDPLDVITQYTYGPIEVAAYLHPIGSRPPTILVIGGGGYTLPRYFAAAYPGAIIDVLELDAEVTAIARERLGLPADPPFTIRHGDARQTVEQLPPERRYDLVVLDAFADIVVPHHLATLEFDARIRRLLTPDGTYVAMVHDRADSGRLLPAFARTVAAEFGSATVLANGPGVRWDSPRPRTWSVVAGALPLDPERFRASRRLAPNGLFPPVCELMPTDVLARLLERDGPPLLTDDHAPVEILAAPLLR